MQPDAIDGEALIVFDSRGRAVVFGGTPDLGQPLFLLGEPEVRRTADALQAAVPLAALSMLSGLDGARTVKLSVGTMVKLARGHRFLESGGQALGVLSKGGRITGVAAFAGGGVSGAIAAAAPFAAAALAVAHFQQELNVTQDLIRENTELTEEIANELRTKTWHTVSAHWAAIEQEYKHAKRVGAVTSEIWDHAQSQASETTLRAERESLLEKVVSHRDNIAACANVESRGRWILKHQQTILRDIYALTAADDAWFRYQGLRAGHLSRESTAGSEKARLSLKVS